MENDLIKVSIIVTLCFTLTLTWRNQVCTGVPLQTAVGGCRYGRPAWVQPGSRLTCAMQPQEPRGAALSQLIQTNLKLSHKEECLQRCLWWGSSTLTLVGCCARLAARRTLISAYSVLFAHTKTPEFHHTLASKRCDNMLFISSPDRFIYWQRWQIPPWRNLFWPKQNHKQSKRHMLYMLLHMEHKKERVIFFLSVCDSSLSQSACGLCRAVLQ